MTLMSVECTRILFSTLRKFKDEDEVEKIKEVDPSELQTVRQMVILFFDQLRCPECLTPFIKEGGCMAMTCKGRPGVICSAHFCLWCMRVPQEVQLLGPNASDEDMGNACHRHVFQCPLAPHEPLLPNPSRLFPTKDEEDIDWIVAWHRLHAINKALKFLREFVAPNTAAAVFNSKDILQMFEEAADVVRALLKKAPADCRLLQLPVLKLDPDMGDQEEMLELSDSSNESSEDDYVFRPQLPVIPRMRVPPRAIAPPRADLPQERIWDHFQLNVQFIMDACNCNRRQATDALFANDRDPLQAIEYLLRLGE